MIDKKSVRNILITRTDRLGDVILTLPLVSCMRKIFPDAEIYLLVKFYLKDLLENYKGADGIIYSDDPEYHVPLKKILKEKKIDIAVNVKPEFSQALDFYTAGVKYRIGSAYRWFSFLYNCKVYEHRRNSDKHESELNLNLIRNFFNEDCNSDDIHFNISEDNRRSLNLRLKETGLNPDDKYIVVHPGSGSSAKDLSPEQFKALVRELGSEFTEYKIVLTGITGESELINGITAGQENFNIINLCGMLNLGELMILIDQSSLFISNSTGPIHIAGALNKKLIGFYPNKKPMDAGRWGPTGGNKIILSPGEDSDDMKEIRTDEILSAVKKLLN
ncbi:MAG: glycosyltransferase family 9 protein [Bacteroidetes bacterium]|nr:glycosyltransferase family 9 protein [Bacteroidota bacterium]